MPRSVNRLKSLGILITGFLITVATNAAPVLAAPTVTLAAPDTTAAERQNDSGKMTVTRSGPTTTALTVRYTVSGTATNGSDYDRLSGTVSIPAKAASAVITVRPIDDTMLEPSETVVVTLAANAAYTLGAAIAGTVTIADNDRPLPVLMVIANDDFYYTEYGTPRREFEAAGIPVVVGAGRRQLSTPHPNTGQGSSDGRVMPDIDLASARAANYSAIVFVGGWGASQYQYAFPGTYNHAPYNATPAIRSEANRLINEFQLQNKYVTAICNGVNALAWARVKGESPIRRRRVTTADFNTPANNIPGAELFRWHCDTNGAAAVFVGGAYGNPATYADDVIVDGRIITGGNQDSATQFGRTVANRILGR
ncbi:MAG: Calx-beta domain-containing protein [Planctomycetota bacterium]